MSCCLGPKKKASCGGTRMLFQIRIGRRRRPQQQQEDGTLQPSMSTEDAGFKDDTNSTMRIAIVDDGDGINEAAELRLLTEDENDNEKNYAIAMTESMNGRTNGTANCIHGKETLSPMQTTTDTHPEPARMSATLKRRASKMFRFIRIGHHRKVSRTLSNDQTDKDSAAKDGALCLIVETNQVLYQEIKQQQQVLKCTDSNDYNSVVYKDNNDEIDTQQSQNFNPKSIPSDNNGKSHCVLCRLLSWAPSTTTTSTKPISTAETVAAVTAKNPISSIATNHKQPYTPDDDVFDFLPRWSATEELKCLHQHGWYWGPLTRREAEAKLANQPDGTFLVRDCSVETCFFCISLRENRQTCHCLIQSEFRAGHRCFFIQNSKVFARTVAGLIDHHICSPLKMQTASGRTMELRLDKPLSRFENVSSLQHLCRFIIRQHTRIDAVDELPLPVSIKAWLKLRPY